MLVTDDQFIQQAGILAFQPRGNGEVLLPRLLVNDGGGTRREKWANERGCTHLTLLDDRIAAEFRKKNDFSQKLRDLRAKSQVTGRIFSLFIHTLASICAAFVSVALFPIPLHLRPQSEQWSASGTRVEMLQSHCRFQYCF
jgi:hypothetical protein